MTTRGIRYELAPATRMLWRDPDVVQFESGEQSVVVDGLSTRTARGLTHPTGDAPDAACVPAPQHLADLRLVWPRDESAEDDRRAVAVPALAGELAALATGSGRGRRRCCGPAATCSVAVHGPGRVGPTVGAVLAASRCR